MAGAVIAMLALCLAPCLAFAHDGGSGPSSNLLKAGIIVASDLDAQDEPTVLEEGNASSNGKAKYKITSDGVLTIYGEGNVNTKLAFTYNDVITAVVIEEGITQLGANALRNNNPAPNAKRLSIPLSLTAFASTSLNREWQLDVIYYAGSPDDWEDVTGKAGNTALDPNKMVFGREPTVLSLTVDPAEKTLNIDGTVGLTATPAFAEGASPRDVYFESSDTTVATVDSAGTVTARSVGTATITAHCGAQTAVCAITVEWRSLFSGSCGAPGSSAAWSLLENGELRISGEGAMADFADGAAPWISHAESIKSVTVREGVTSVGAYAFSNLTQATSFSLSNTVESIGSHAFEGSSAVKEIALPDSLTSIGEMAFKGCTALDGYFCVPEGVQSVGAELLSSCSSISYLRLPKSLVALDAHVLDGSAVTCVYYNGTADEWAALGFALPEGVSLHSAEDTSVPLYMRLDFLDIQENTSGRDYPIELSPAFDPEIRDYTVYVPDYNATSYGITQLSQTAAGQITDFKISNTNAALDPTIRTQGYYLTGSGVNAGLGVLPFVNPASSLKGGTVDYVYHGETAYHFDVVRFATPNGGSSDHEALRVSVDGIAATMTPDFNRRNTSYDVYIPRAETAMVETITNADRNTDNLSVNINGVARGDDYRAEVPLTWKDDRTAEIIVEYSAEGAKTNTIVITAHEVPQELKIANQPNKTVYELREVFDPTGMEVMAVFADGEPVALTAEDYDVYPAGELFPADTFVTIRYRTTEVNVPIVVNNQEVPDELQVISNLTVWSANAINSGGQYVMEPAFDSAVRAYTVHVRDNSSNLNLRGDIVDSDADVKVEYTNVNGDPASLAFSSTSLMQNVFPSILNGGRSAQNTVFVKVNGEVAYVLNCVPFNTLKSGSFRSLNGNRVVLKAVAQNDRGRMGAEGYLNRDDKLKVTLTARGGDTTLRVGDTQVNSGEATTFDPVWDDDRIWSFDVTVAAPGADIGVYPMKVIEPVTSLEITKAPSFTEFPAGSAFDPAGMELKAIYADGTERAVSPDEVTVTPAILTASTTQVTIAFRQATVTQGITVTGGLEGAGTQEDPFLVKTAADYESIRALVLGGVTFQGQYLKQTADITLPGSWQSIGVLNDDGSYLLFRGNLDGDGHTLTVPAGAPPLFGQMMALNNETISISNLKVKGERIAGAGLIDSMALMGSGAVNIDNVTLLRGSSTLKSGLVDGSGRLAHMVRLSNCVVEDGVTVGYGKNRSHIGSFVGALSGAVENCTSSAKVYGVNDVGGIVGLKAQSMSAFLVRGCEFAGTVTATGRNVGGIVGGGYYSTTAPNTALVNIIDCVCSGSVSGVRAVGGILGAEPGVDEPWPNAPGSITGNRFTGKVSGETQVGGVIGFYRALNCNVRIEANYYAENSGAERGIGFVTHVDTSAVPLGWRDGTFYFNTADWSAYSDEQKAEIYAAVDADWKPDAPYSSDWAGQTPRWGNASISGADLHRADDPLGVDAEVLCYTDGAPDVCRILELSFSDSFKHDYNVGEELSLDGLTVTGTWTSGATQTVEPASAGNPDGYEIAGFDPWALGDQEVTVTCGLASASFTITVTKDAGVDFDESARGTVYVSISDDDRFVISGGILPGVTMAYVPIALADVAQWANSNAYGELGLGDYARWAPVEANYNYDLTALQLFTYVQAEYADSGAGGFEISGVPGSAFVTSFFGHDLNFNYYVNGEYPRQASGQGATCDEIALSDGDYVDIAMFTDWNFLNDPAAGFHYFMGLDGVPTHAFEAAAGREATIPLARIYERTDGYEPEAGWTVHWGTAEDWASYGSDSPTEKGSAVTGNDGAARIAFPEAGTYYVWADGGKGVADATKDSIVSAPACAAVTVGPPADEATLGNLEAAIGEAASTASAIAASADGTDVPAGTAWATPEAKAALDEALAAARAVLADPGTTQRRAEEAITSVGEAISALMAASRDGLKIAPAADGSPKVEAGKTYQVGGMSYKVTKVASGNANGTVTLTKAKDASSVSVPAAVKLADGKSYAVDTIATKAFSKLKKLKKATVGANVKKIEKSAFFKTPKLKKLVVKSKLLKKKASVKGALKGSKAKKLAVKAPKVMKKAYKKSFSKKNLKAPKKVTVK